MKAGKRLAILSNSEIESLYRIPSFSTKERAFYFSLDESKKTEMELLKSLESRVYFILQLGYFKCKSMFFKFTFLEVKEDVRYILDQYFQGSNVKNMISKRTRLDNNLKILKILSYKYYDKEFENKLLEILCQYSKTLIDRRFIFDSILNYLEQERISIPGYSTLQKIISKVLLEEQERLQSIISKSIPQHVDKIFQRLLDNDEQMYGVTILKKDAKGFKYKDVMREIDKKCSSEKLYNFAQKTIPKLKISSQNVSYYASLVDYYSVDKLRGLSYEKVRLYLLCYVFYRFQKINDNLVNSFIYHVNNYKKQAKEAAKEMVYKHKVEGNSCFKKVWEIMDLFMDDSLPDSMPFGEVRPKAFSIVTKEQFPLLRPQLTGKEMDEDKFKWEHYSVISKKITKNIRPLAKTIFFESEDPHDPLIKALDFLRGAFEKGKSLTKIKSADFPIDFIPFQLKPYLYTEEKIQKEKKLNVHQYEFLVYNQLEHHLNSGRIFINNSVSFKSLKKDLGDEKRNRKFLKTLNNPVLTLPIKAQLEALKKELNPLLLKVNERIKSEENKDIKIKKDGTWTLPYKKKDKD